MRCDRLTLLGLALALVALTGGGCARLVLGPDPGRRDNGRFWTPAEIILEEEGLEHRDEISRGGDGYGPETGFSATAHLTQALSLDVVARRTDLADLSERTVFIPGLLDSPRRRPRARLAFGQPIRRVPEVARKADVRYLSVQLAQQVLAAHGQLALDRADADLILFPWVEVSRGITTHREYDWNRYPLYFHEEDQSPAWVLIFLYDRKSKRLDVIEGDRTWQVKIDSYILGIIPVEWFIGM